MSGKLKRWRAAELSCPKSFNDLTTSGVHELTPRTRTRSPLHPSRPSHRPALAAPGVISVWLLCATISATASANAETPDWRLALDGGAVKQFESSLDTGGDFDIDRYFFRFSATRDIGSAWNAGISLGYGENRYGFSGSSGFGGIDPWSKIRGFRVSVPIRYRADDKWSFVGIPSLRYSGESGADWSDSQQWGVLAAAAYRVSDRLTIGPGFGIFSEIEDDTDFFPIVLVDWKISDTLSLNTGRGLAASRGPGLSLSWTPKQRWRLSLEGRYEKTRFRLDDGGPVPDGVGQDQSIPIALAVAYKPTPDLELSLLGGVEFSGKLRLEDSSGNRLTESDYDTAPFAGAFVKVRF